MLSIFLETNLPRCLFSVLLWLLKRNEGSAKKINRRNRGNKRYTSLGMFFNCPCRRLTVFINHSVALRWLLEWALSREIADCRVLCPQWVINSRMQHGYIVRDKSHCCFMQTKRCTHTRSESDFALSFQFFEGRWFFVTSSFSLWKVLYLLVL